MKYYYIRVIIIIFIFSLVTNDQRNLGRYFECKIYYRNREYNLNLSPVENSLIKTHSTAIIPFQLYMYR